MQKTPNPSILIIGKNLQKVTDIINEKKAEAGINKEKHLDFFEIRNEAKSISIDKTRESFSFLAKKPFSAKKKILVIYDAEKLTPDAQNSLLKNLEEPNKSSQIILVTENETSLLPTIISRSLKIYANEIFVSKDEVEKLAVDFLNGDISKKLELLSVNKKLLSEKDSFINFLNTCVAELRKNLNKESATKIKFLLSIKKDLETTNVNLKLASDFICTHL